MASKLFAPITFRELELRNRIVVSPMCQYSAVEGVPTNWHLVHLGARAVGGAGIVFCEATGVSPEGRISPGDTGIWNETQVKAWTGITRFIREHGAAPGIQLAHAGRKASTYRPWDGDGALKDKDGAWIPLAPSALRFADNYPMPKTMNVDDIAMVHDQFAAAARNALKAGFEVAELHFAHGYLLNEFLSPLSNHRTDEYGGSLENRMRLPLRIAESVRKLWPAKWPVFIRISASDWMPDGFTLEDAIAFARKVKALGIDLIDCSSGGIAANAQIKAGPNYQVPFAEGVRKGAEIATGAVGIITEAHQAEEILRKDQADLIFMARELLRDPYWPLHAAKILGDDISWPKQYARAKR